MYIFVKITKSMELVEDKKALINDTKLFKVLKKFDKYEQNKLRKYVSSPYFNRDQHLLKLYNTIVLKINKNSSEHIYKKQLWKAMKTDRPYDDVRFRKYCSDLLKLVQGYLSQQFFEDSSFYRNNFLLQEIKKRKLEELYNSSLRAAKRDVNDSIGVHPDAFLELFQIEERYFEIIDFETKRHLISNLDEMDGYLNSYFISRKLEIICSAIYRSSQYSHDYNIQFVDQIIEFVNNIEYKNYPYIAIYYHILLTLIHQEDDEYYYKLKDEIEKNIDRFEIEEIDKVYTYVLNYCFGKINKGRQEFLEEVFYVYKSLIDRNLILENNQITPWRFKNITLIALRLGKFKWTESFIIDFKEKLQEDFRENAVRYNLALLYFYLKKYEKVIQQLQFVEYEDPAYNLDSKAMLIGSYYELDELEPLYSLFESFRAYLNRHKDIPEERRKRYLNLIKFTRRLTKIDPRDKQALEKLKKDIQSSEGVVSIKWLNEKISELEG